VKMDSKLLFRGGGLIGVMVLLVMCSPGKEQSQEARPETTQPPIATQVAGKVQPEPLPAVVPQQQQPQTEMNGLIRMMAQSYYREARSNILASDPSVYLYAKSLAINDSYLKRSDPFAKDDRGDLKQLAALSFERQAINLAIEWTLNGEVPNVPAVDLRPVKEKVNDLPIRIAEKRGISLQQLNDTSLQIYSNLVGKPVQPTQPGTESN
jgi:hypothetical protein